MAAGPSRKAWWALVGLVLLAHAWLLGGWWQGHANAPPTRTPAPTRTTVVTTATAPITADAAPPPSPPIDRKITSNPPPALIPKQVIAIKSEKPTPPPSAPAVPPPQAETAAVSAAPPATAPMGAEEADKAEDSAPDTTPPGTLKWPAPVELRYDVHATRKGLSLAAESVLHWQPSDTGYQARMEIKAPLFGQRSQTSVGTLDLKKGLQPTRYGDKNRSEQATHFDRTRSPPALRFSANTPDLPLQPHTQDRLSVLLQLAAMFAGKPGRFERGDTVALHTAGPRDADVWRFQVGASAAMALPVGTLDTVHLVRAPLHAYDNRVELWLAPRLGYLPVRILWTQANGDVVDQRLNSHTP